MPEKIDLKVGTKLQELWHRVVEKEEMSIENLENELIIHKAVLTMAREKEKQESELNGR